MARITIRPLSPEDLDRVSDIETRISVHPRRGSSRSGSRRRRTTSSPAQPLWTEISPGTPSPGSRKANSAPGTPWRFSMSSVSPPTPRGRESGRRSSPKWNGRCGPWDRDAADPGRLGKPRDDPLLLLHGIPPRPVQILERDTSALREEIRSRERGIGCAIADTRRRGLLRSVVPRPRPGALAERGRPRGRRPDRQEAHRPGPLRLLRRQAPGDADGIRDPGVARGRGGRNRRRIRHGTGRLREFGKVAKAAVLDTIGVHPGFAGTGSGTPCSPSSS